MLRDLGMISQLPVEVIHYLTEFFYRPIRDDSCGVTYSETSSSPLIVAPPNCCSSSCTRQVLIDDRYKPKSSEGSCCGTKSTDSCCGSKPADSCCGSKPKDSCCGSKSNDSCCGSSSSNKDSIVVSCCKGLIQQALDGGSGSSGPNTHDLRHLLNCCRFFQTLKYDKLYYALNSEYSLLFYEDKHFQNKVINKVACTSCQIGLRFKRNILSSIFDIKVDLHTLEIYHSNYLTTIALSPFHLLHTAILFNCNKLTKVSDLRSLQRLEIFDSSELQDVSALGSIPILKLSGCSRLIHLNGLGQGNQLIEISFCDNIIDITPLATVPYVCLCNCMRINSIEALSSAQYLNVNDCPSIQDFRPASTVPEVGLHTSRLRDVSFLCNLRRLDLSGCKNVSDVSCLGRIHTLNLSRCVGVVEVNMLQHVYNLNISHNPNIRDISGLGQVHSLDISYCPRIKEIKKLIHVKILIMIGNYSIEDFEIWSRLINPTCKYKR